MVVVCADYDWIDVCVQWDCVLCVWRWSDDIVCDGIVCERAIVYGRGWIDWRPDPNQATDVATADADASADGYVCCTACCISASDWTDCGGTTVVGVMSGGGLSGRR